MTDKSFSGKGQIFIGVKDSGLRYEVGNAQITLGASATEQRLPNYTSGGGGSYNSFDRLDSVDLSLIFNDFNAENMRRAVFGSSSAIAAAAVTDESIAAPSSLTGNPFVPFEFVADLDQTVTVTTDPAGTTYVAGTDYELLSGGIRILSTGSISADEALLVTYTKAAVDKIEGQTQSAQEYEIFVVGENEAQSGAPFRLQVYRAKFGPGEEIALIQDGFAEVTVSGEALPDSTKTGTGISQYYKLELG